MEFSPKFTLNSCNRLVYTLKELLDFLEDLGLLDRSVIIFTSDHGELLNERGLIGHGHAYPFNELIQCLL